MLQRLLLVGALLLGATACSEKHYEPIPFACSLLEEVKIVDKMDTEYILNPTMEREQETLRLSMCTLSDKLDRKNTLNVLIRENLGPVPREAKDSLAAIISANEKQLGEKVQYEVLEFPVDASWEGNLSSLTMIYRDGGRVQIDINAGRKGEEIERKQRAIAVAQLILAAYP